MHLLIIPRLALRALLQNPLRTSLTMLGIVIGVGAVICVVALGEGASASVEHAITNIGANMIWVEAGGVNRSGVRTGAFGTKTLTLGDYEAIKEHIPLGEPAQSIFIRVWGQGTAADLAKGLRYALDVEVGATKPA